MTATLVYLGPSLPLAVARTLLADADFRPPVRRGDLPDTHEGAVLIIDGEFGQSLAVSPKEILRLLDGGTRVIGAASMGALRAAELHAFGMEGCGWVFSAYRSGAVIRDDEVAVIYRPSGYQTLTVPLINVRHWLEALEATGAVDASLAGLLLRSAGRIFFADRTADRLLEVWESIAGARRLDELLTTSGGITDIKAEDAAMALTTLAGELVPSTTYDGGQTR